MSWESGHWFLPSDDETILKRWAGRIVCAEAPEGTDQEDVLLLGDGILVLTSRRIVGSLGSGKSTLGLVDERGDDGVLFSLELAALERISVKGDPVAVSIITVTPRTFLVLMVTHEISENRRARDGSNWEAGLTIARAYADLRRPSASAEEMRLLECAAQGHWQAEGRDRTAALRLADDEDPGAPAIEQRPGGAVPVATVKSDAAAGSAPAADNNPGAWYPDVQRPGRWRWWDGSAWGIRDDEHDASVTDLAIDAVAETSPAGSAPPGTPVQNASPVIEPEILRERLARGEIALAEYQALLDGLRREA